MNNSAIPMSNSANQPNVTDSLGRIIFFRKITALDRLRIFEALGAELSENQNYLAHALIAASVTKINTLDQPFPRSKRAIENVVDSLGDEGFQAVSQGYSDHFRPGDSTELEDVRPLQTTAS
jgi:hypothetical protein